MKNIKISVTGNLAEVTENHTVVSGTVGLGVEFVFDQAWHDLKKTAVFRANGKSMDCVSLTDAATIPWELLQTPGCRLFAGVYGTNADGSLQIPTVWADLGVIQPGADPSGDESADPSLPVWAQVHKEAVKYTPQTLTEEQKAQARENIGVEDTYIIRLCDGNEQYWIIDSQSIIPWDEFAAMAKTNRRIICRYCGTTKIYDDSYVDDFSLSCVDYKERIAVFSSVTAGIVKSLSFYEYRGYLAFDDNSRAEWRFSIEAMEDAIENHTTALGNIETALDSIIAIQESLIRGDAK